MLFICVVNAYGQWTATTQPNLSTNGDLKSLFFINENIGFVGGSLNQTEAKLNKTIDGGLTWTWISYQFTNCTSINSIFFVDVNNGFVTTNNQNISFKTTDGGISWTQVFCQTAHPGKVYFKNSMIGFFYSDISALQNFSYTTNGGLVWTLYNLPFGKITSINFPNTTSSIGYMMLITGHIYKTTNNGLNWNLINNGAGFTNYSSLYFINELIGFRVSSVVIERTTDGGLNWQIIYQINGKKILFTASTIAYLSGFNNSQNSNEIFRADYQNSASSPLQFTQMSGTNSPLFNSAYLIDFQFPTINVGYALSTNKNLYKLNTTLGIDKNYVPKLLIYPNPTKDILNIENLNVENKKYSVFDLNGRLVTKGIIENLKINVSELSKGIYIIKIAENLKEIKFKKE